MGREKAIKRIVAFILLGVIAFAVNSCSADEKKIGVSINGKEISFDVSPVIIEGRTLVPLRAIFEALEVNVWWDDSTKTVMATTEGKIIILQIDNNIAFVNSEKLELEVSAKLIEGRTLVPVRFIAETLGAEVKWDETERMVSINKSEEGIYRQISPSDAKARLETGSGENKNKIYLIDVRTPEEYKEGYIKESILLPSELKGKIESVVKDKNSEIILYCRSGNRSRTASYELLELGYKNVYDLGGIIDWPYDIEK